jgi:hypothetical protein
MLFALMDRQQLHCAANLCRLTDGMIGRFLGFRKQKARSVSTERALLNN